MKFSERTCACGRTFHRNTDDTREDCSRCLAAGRAKAKRQASPLTCANPSCRCRLLIAVPSGLCGFCGDYQLDVSDARGDGSPGRLTHEEAAA